MKFENQNSDKSCCRLKTDTFDKISSFLGEVLGTGMLVFVGCMGCVKTDIFPNNNFQMGLNFGLVVLICIQCFGCVSGAHFNPAVTIAAYIYNMISAPMAIIYFCAQMLGGFLGYGLLMAILSSDKIKPAGSAHGLCMTVVHEDITTMQGLAIEFISTATLILLCCGCWDPRNSKHADSLPLRFGLAVSCLSITFGPFTGASMNPARSFGPALWNNDFESHWVYWVGPLAAGAIIALSYKKLLRRELKPAEIANLEDQA